MFCSAIHYFQLFFSVIIVLAKRLLIVTTNVTKIIDAFRPHSLSAVLHEYLSLYIREHSEYSPGSVSKPFHAAFLVREDLLQLLVRFEYTH